MLITSNRSVAEWGTVFGDPAVTTALLDRLLHHSHVITIRGDSSSLRLIPLTFEYENGAQFYVLPPAQFPASFDTTASDGTTALRDASLPTVFHEPQVACTLPPLMQTGGYHPLGLCWRW
jgi:hypothetical protein